jgi:hypothetical protein
MRRVGLQKNGVTRAKTTQEKAKAVENPQRRWKWLVVEEQRFSDIARPAFLLVGRLDKPGH